MKIVIDGRLWGESGIGRYLRNLILNLQTLDKQNQYYILLLKKDYDNLNFSSNFHKVLADFKWYGVIEQVKLLQILNSLNPDLVHFTHFNIPVFYKRKFVVTIHDLIHQHFQTRETTTLNPLLHFLKKTGYKKVFTSAVKNSQKIITPSEFVKNQLIEEWKINPEKITVTYEGVDQNIINLAKKKHPSPKVEPYLFYVGNAQPHKNIPSLIKAFAKLREKYPDLNLILAGPPNHFWEKIKSELHSRGVTFIGFVSDEELVALYQNAQAFVMPSLEEGFGIPILEAMACGCPVVSSNAASMPEVGGDAATYFDPKSEEEMAEAIEKALNSKNIQAGLEQVKKFSWQKMAEQTLKIYKNPEV